MTYTSESESSEAVDFCMPFVPSQRIEEHDNVKQLEVIFLKRHQCDEPGCSASFSRPWRLEAHKAIHSGKKPYPCDYPGCIKAYTSNFHLRRHKSTAHVEPSIQKKIRCSYEGCLKEFSLIQNARKHFRRSHVNTKKTCKTCGELFLNHLELKKHNKLHKYGYNLKCQECNITFEYAAQFHRHKRGHKVYICSIKGCDGAYENWSLLRKHLAKHPHDYVCYYCKKGYRRRKFLKRHVLCHLNNCAKRKPYELKKFSCDICQTEVLGKASLKRHKKQVHETPKEENLVKSKKERAPRKDKGIPKRALAVVLAEIAVPKEVEKKLIDSQSSILDSPEIFSKIQ